MPNDKEAKKNHKNSQLANPVQVQKFLKGVDYPAQKGDLVKTARGKGADENIISTLEQLPDEEFETPAEVSQAIGKLE